MIRWSYIQNLQKLQADKGLRAANKLTKQHVLYEKCKMKVKIAAQTLSQSVSTSLTYVREINTDFAGCEATATWIAHINR